MTPRQARNIATWQILHPFFYVVPYDRHVVTPGDPWKYLIRQEDNDHLIGTVSRTMHVATRDFNQGLVDQLWRSLTTGQPPKEGGHRPLATPLVSPDGGTLTPHPSTEESDERPSTNTDNPHHLDKSLTRHQSEILASWEILHPEFQVIRDPEHKKVNFSAWRFKVIDKKSRNLMGWFEPHRYGSTIPSNAQMIGSLKNSFIHNRKPKAPTPTRTRLRDPLTGRLMTRPSPSPGQGPTVPHFPGWGTPEWSDAAHDLASGGDYPPPIPELGKPIVLTGYGLHLWKHGGHVPYPGPDAPPIQSASHPRRTKFKSKAKNKTTTKS
jgi:hypothetical protein